MNTKDQIKAAALHLFNEKGMRNVTLRQVAEHLDRSYGNITYHFKNKGLLITALYLDMLEELEALGAAIRQEKTSLLLSLLKAPQFTYELSLKYLFLYVDFVEIYRSYPDLAQLVNQQNEKRKKVWLKTLQQLQREQLLRTDLNNSDLGYLMELSGAMRTYFFLKISTENRTEPDLKSEYVQSVNQLLKPYLTKAGLKVFRAVER